MRVGASFLMESKLFRPHIFGGGYPVCSQSYHTSYACFGGLRFAEKALSELQLQKRALCVLH
jgi:hypothetical protein